MLKSLPTSRRWPPIRPRLDASGQRMCMLGPGPAMWHRDWILEEVPEQVEMGELVGGNSVRLVAWYAEIPPSIVCLGWSCSKGEDVSKPLQRWFEHG